MLFVAILAVSAVSAADNVTDDVVSVDNDDKIILSQESETSSFQDLSDEINKTSDGGVLNLTKDYVYKSGSTDGIVLNKSITIDGKNHKIDGNGTSRIFTAYDGNITLKNLVLVNGYSKVGGAISAKNITLNNVTFENNRATSQGGAVYVSTGITVENCVFDANSAFEGAAIYIPSQVIPPLTPPADYNGTDMDDNGTEVNSTDVDGNGTDTNSSDDDDVLPGSGGEYKKPYDFKIINSVFKNSQNIGFGLIHCNSDQTLSIFNSTFENSSAQYGTAICSIYSNSINITDSKFYNLHANHTGGAIAMSSLTDLFLINCEFVNDSAVNNGGAVYADANGWNRGSTGEMLINGTLFKNCSSNFAGAVGLMAGKLNVYNSEFINNSAKYLAGALFMSDPLTEARILNSNFVNNKLTSQDLGNGGALYLDSMKFILISNSNFTDNTKNAVYLYDSKYNITNSNFKGNTEAIHGVYSSKISLDGNNYAQDKLVENSSEGNFIVVNSEGLKLDLVNNVIYYENLPARFDSRDWGWVSSVKNQGISGACWVFSSLSALESALLKATGVEYNLAINPVHKNLLSYSKYGETELTEAGLCKLALEYLLTWFAPYNESYEPFDELGKIDIVNMPSDTIHIQDAVIIPIRKNLTDNDAFKQAIINYGAVATDFYVVYNAPYFNNNTNAYYYNGTLEPASHAITVVGWDDNYPASNFLITPPGNGAWIVKNSYGPDKYDNGYIYVSYWDTIFGRDGNGIAFVINNTERYNKNYQTDASGLATLVTSASEYMYKNSYKASEADFISAVGTYFNDKDEAYTLEVYVNDVLKLTQSGKAPFGGFHTVKLTNYIPVKAGDIFTVVMKTHSVPLVNESRHHFASGISFVNDGTGWKDVALENKTVSLKVYTTPLVNLTADLKVSDVATVYNGGKYLSVVLSDVYGDPIKGEKVTITLSNGVTKTLTTDNNGRVQFSTDGLAVKSYTAKVTFNGNADYKSVTKTVNVNVKKASLKMTAKAKSFKKSHKSKKYSVVVKNANKAVRNIKLTLKVNGKTYSAKTNSKGAATFKITKLTKKGKFTAKISFAGNSYYNALSKSVKITVKK